MATWIWEVVNWFSLPVLAVLAVILLRRGLQREFPFFFWFIIVTEVATVLRFLMQFASPKAYFYSYWTSDLVITVFNFLAVYELFMRRLFPRFLKVRFFRYLFPVAAALIIFFAWLTALESPDKNAAFLIEARVLNFILVAIIAFFVALMMLMGRQWTRHDFGIALGFGLNSAAFLIASAAWVGSKYHATAVNHLPLIAYDISSLVWLYCFWSLKASNTNSQAPPVDPEILHEARKWEDSLKDLLIPGKRLF